MSTKVEVLMITNYLKKKYPNFSFFINIPKEDKKAVYVYWNVAFTYFFKYGKKARRIEFGQAMRIKRKGKLFSKILKETDKSISLFKKDFLDKKIIMVGCKEHKIKNISFF